MPLQATSGAASYDAFGGGVAAVPKYIEEYFSTFLFSGTGSDQTITNNIDLSTKGGLVWLKKRTYPSGSVTSHYLMDTNRGTSAGYLSSNSTDAENAFDIVSSFNTNGFGFNTPVNDSGDTYASWSLAKAPKFFDVVTWSGNGTIGRTISHSLGSVPGCIIVKKTNSAGASDWVVYHRSLGATKAMLLNLTDSVYTWNVWNDTAPTSTVFSLNDASEVNGAGNSYVAYLFAHNAGGFGLTGTDNVISCGSYTGNGSSTGPEVNIGYEPQWLLIKEATQSGNSWSLYDNMRGLSVAAPSGHLRPNDSASEDTTTIDMRPTATGFQPISSSGRVNRSGETFIYIAIRRGPMKVPTSGTSVFATAFYRDASAVSNNVNYYSGFVTDSIIFANRTGGNHSTRNRLTGANYLVTNLTDAETTVSGEFFQSNVGAGIATTGSFSSDLLYWMFRRAPSTFDVVCYTGNGSTQNITHNLGVAPELMIVKMRSATSATGWIVYAAPLANAATSYLVLNSTDAVGTGNTVLWNSTAPTSSVFSLGASSNINTNGATNVAYLFATCPNVSKVTTFTGNGSSQTINCGFTSGARFVMIKRVDSTGNWVTFDTARGISSGGDPALYLNSTAAEVTGVDAIDTDSTGFIVNQEATFNLNVSSATYLVLAIA